MSLEETCLMNDIIADTELPLLVFVFTSHDKQCE
jgi:hypothetical protein